MSLASEPLRCADAALARGDTRAATAPPTRRFLLVEQSGPWGRDAVRESRLGHDLGAELIGRAAEVSARVLLIRRVGRAQTEGPRRWGLVDTAPGAERTWWGFYHHPADLLELPLDGTVGERSDAVTYLVCTHGRHDTCCAVRGRPVAAAFSAIRPHTTWECSHVGGDRFAANVVVAPYGLYYGHLPTAGVSALVTDSEAGRVQVEHLRGRASYPAPVQAAQHYARLALGEQDIATLAPVHSVDRADDSWHVVLGHGSGPVDVVVRATMTAVEGRLTCAAVRPGHVRSFALVSLDAAGIS